MTRFVVDETPSWVRALRNVAATGAGIGRYRSEERDRKERRQYFDWQKRRAELQDERAGRAETRAAESHRATLRNAQAEFLEEERQRQLNQRQAKASLEWDLYRLDTLRGKRPQPVRGPLSLGMNMAGQALDSERVRGILETLAPEQREGALAFLQERQQRRVLDQQVKSLVGEIQAAAEPPEGVEPWLAPEQAQAIIKDLQDVNRPDIGPDQVRALLDKQRTFVRNLRVARSTFSANFMAAQAMAAAPEPPPELGISRVEWMARRREAKTLIEDWGTNWAAWDPDKKYAEVMDVLRRNPKHDPIEVRQRVLQDLQQDPNYQALETEAERRQYRDNIARWTLTGLNPVPSPAEVEAELGGPMQELQAFRDGPIGYSTKISPLTPEFTQELQGIARGSRNPKDADAKIAAVLEREGVKPDQLDPKLREELFTTAQAAGKGAFRGDLRRPAARMPPERSASTLEGGPDYNEQLGERYLSRERAAQEAARGNANVAAPKGAQRAASKARGREAMQGEHPGTYTQMSAQERAIVERLVRRHPKNARQMLERMGIDLASLPPELRRIAAGRK